MHIRRDVIAEVLARLRGPGTPSEAREKRTRYRKTRPAKTRKPARKHPKYQRGSGRRRTT